MIHRFNLSGSHRHGFSTIAFLSLFFITAQVSAQGVFLSRDKSTHPLKGVELNRIKAEHQQRFGQRRSTAPHYSTNNPWEKKKQKSQGAAKGASWGECRDYALHKRNRCYREGRDAYSCERAYEARARLCDSSL